MSNFLSKGISTPIGILIIVLVAIIAGSSILAYQYWWVSKQETKIPEEVIENEIEKCKNVQDLIKQSECWTNLAKGTKDESYCEKITDEYIEFRWDCYVGLAILKNDLLLCEKVGRGSLYESCLEHFQFLSGEKKIINHIPLPPEGDKLEKGYRCTFSWCGEDPVFSQKGLSNLYLLKGDVNMGLIAEDVTTTTGYIKCPFWGEYSWEIGKLTDNLTISAGTNYKIKVKFFDLNGELSAKGESDYFSIVDE